MAHADTQAFTYSGRDNLEAMQQAYRYNAYLQALVEEAGRGCEKWLDFGAGTGQFAVPLSRKGFQVTALEPDAALVQSLIEQGVHAISDIAAIDDAAIDFAYSLNVLEHIEDDVAALKMLYKKMVKSGRLLIYVPAFQSLYSTMDSLVGHHRRYSKSELIKKVVNAGFTVNHCAYVDSLGFLASWLYRQLPNQTGVITPQSVSVYDRFVFPTSRLLDRITQSFIGKNLVLSARA